MKQLARGGGRTPPSPTEQMFWETRGRGIRVSMKRKKLLLLAVPRSGTRGISNALVTAGLKVGHEKMKGGGIVSGFFAYPDYWHPGCRWDNPSGYVFERIWHQTRHPLPVAASWAADIPGMIWVWQERHTGVPYDPDEPELAGLRIWLEWNRAIERCAPQYRYRVEDLKAEWPVLCGRLGMSNTPFDSVRKQYKHRAMPRVPTWDEVKAKDKDLYGEVRILASRYGYKE